MPILTAPLTPGQGLAFVNLEVAASAPRALSLAQGGLPVPPSRFRPGLIDTGASTTCIDPSLRHALNLTPFNKVPILTPSSGLNPPPSYLYKVNLTVIHLGGEPQRNLVRSLLTVVETTIAHLGADVLVGCDVLAQTLLCYDGYSGRFSLAF